jgi:hypothetical protein
VRQLVEQAANAERNEPHLNGLATSVIEGVYQLIIACSRMVLTPMNSAGLVTVWEFALGPDSHREAYRMLLLREQTWKAGACYHAFLRVLHRMNAPALPLCCFAMPDLPNDTPLCSQLKDASKVKHFAGTHCAHLV